MAVEWKRWLLPAMKRGEDADTRTLYRAVERLRARSPFATETAGEQFLFDIVVDICTERGITPSSPLGNALWNGVVDFVVAEGFGSLPNQSDPPANLTMEEGLRLREQLRRTQRFLTDSERLLPLWRRKIVLLFSGMLEYFPQSAFTDVDALGNSLDDSVVFPAAKALDLCGNLPEVIQRALITFFDEDIRHARLFDLVANRLDANVHSASGLQPESTAKVTLPTEHRNVSPDLLVQAYLGGTPLEGFFNAGLPFAIPFPARFEHTHIVGGTGHGKTQLMQFLIHHDLVRSQEDQRSVVVIDSQGDLIRTVSRLRYFSPDAEKNLADRFVMIDPTDIEHPVALNMFDFNRDRLSGYTPLDREKILNATIELYDYFFGALLGAELTQRQGVIFRYLARLLIEIPGATIHTLRELMEDGEKFLPYMEKLTGTARSFFATRFFDKSFNETKKQILARLWGVLSNTALERMFSHKESKIDLFTLLNSGKIIFINTAKDLLGQDGAAIFGRFFIALISQAAIQRASQPSHERRPAFVYIDEAQDYFDTNIGNLLTQARKYRVGLIFAHQSLDQLGSDLRGSVLANTTIKFAGGVSAKDATAVAQELRCDSEFVLAQRRGTTHTSFACSVKNYTGKALSVSIPLGFVEALPTLSQQDEQYLRQINRAEYCAPPEPAADVAFSIRKKELPKQTASKPQVPDVSVKEAETISGQKTVTQEVPEIRELPASALRPEPRTPRPPMPDPGRGGQEHKYLQHLIKRLAEERGFRATIEENILDGAGQVDVSLSKGKQRIACEISVTTGRDHELQNVEKCIAAGYAEILLVGATERHVKTLAKFIGENLEEGHGVTIRYASAETIVDFLDAVAPSAKPSESVVRGYAVKTTTSRLSTAEVEKKRAVVAEVIARSLTRSRKPT